ncbi:RHS repeat domain-containing protein, partial [Pectobacterium brasiliense]|uniref:RHS repeat domain-containing protein n=1 Tax=Pectobacterium brasiliense TaxID=180957 RepID=UPI001968BDCD
ISDSHWGEQAFRLNGAGQVTAERRDEGRRRQARLFGYDSEQNLCEVSQIAPGLGETLKVQDAVVQASARYDAAGRVIERGHTQYRYDDCGRLAVKRETRPGFRPKETYFDWDVQDRLVRVSLPDGARWRYRYDAFGRRVSKVREGQVPSAQAVARVAYRWDGDQLIGQQQYRADGSAAREVQWVYEPGSFRPLAQVEAQGDSTQLHYIVTDLTGTARELCSEEGEVRWRGEQGLWGAHREERRPIPLRRYLGDAANEEVYCELRYQGQLFDAETGLYYNRHRYYDAESGQYLSPDPIGLAGGKRAYGYVKNPLSWVDPLGLTPKEGPSRVDNARARQSKMLEDDVGYNISPTSWDQYPSIGRDGTFVTDKEGALKYFDGVQGSETSISRSMAERIEKDMGLNPGSLKDGFNVRKIEGITNMQPRSPLGGNDYFLGPGQHLPGGAPEMVINSVPTSTPVMLRVNVL